VGVEVRARVDLSAEGLEKKGEGTLVSHCLINSSGNAEDREPKGGRLERPSREDLAEGKKRAKKKR